MKKEPKLSAIILVGGKYDTKLLKKCLASVSWCDEVVKVNTSDLKGTFSDWRNIGAEMAKGEWLLYIDSDEEVTEKLKNEIIKSIQNSSLSYAIPRQNILLGRKMRHGGWWPDYVLRLIKKGNLEGWYGKLHEQPKVKGNVMNLKEPLIHVSHRNLTDMVDKTNEWSEIEAKLLYDSGHPKMNFFRFFSAGFREFWYRAIVKMGFLDGTIGIIEIIYQVFSRLVTYTKLWELQIKQ